MLEEEDEDDDDICKHLFCSGLVGGQTGWCSLLINISIIVLQSSRSYRAIVVLLL